MCDLRTCDIQCSLKCDLQSCDLDCDQVFDCEVDLRTRDPKSVTLSVALSVTFEHVTSSASDLRTHDPKSKTKCDLGSSGHLDIWVKGGLASLLEGHNTS